MANVTLDAQFDDFFALFEQPVQFELSQQALDQRLRTLQKYYHPDTVLKNGHDDANVQQQSEQASAMINQAYQTLSHADSRAAYLLEMAEQTLNIQHSIADLEFLEDAMQMRIDLEDAIECKNRTTLRALRPKIAERLAVQSQRFEMGYQAQNWKTAIDATQKLKFLVKLDADIITALDEVATADPSDDDLYV